MAGQANKIVLRLIEMAKEERRLLVEGRLDELPKLEKPKEVLLSKLRDFESQLPTPSLSKLSTLAVENQKLYAAALFGVQRVRDQVAVLIAGAAEFQTYGANGGRQKLGGRDNGLEKRA